MGLPGAIFLTIFAETGLVVAPFLPGESLLLTSGTLAGAGVLHIAVLWPLLVGAAFLGDVVNYLIGRWLGKHLLSKPRKYLKPEHVRRRTSSTRSTAASRSSPAASSPSCARWCRSSRA